MTVVPICLAAQCAAARPGEEDVLAAMYIRMWSLASGRRLPSSEPGQLSVEELIAFWADDLSPTPGRHAAPDASPAGDAR